MGQTPQARWWVAVKAGDCWSVMPAAATRRGPRRCRVCHAAGSISERPWMPISFNCPSDRPVPIRRDLLPRQPPYPDDGDRGGRTGAEHHPSACGQPVHCLVSHSPCPRWANEW